jgi:MFS family permease
VTILFFLWGFAYDLLDGLNSHFQSELNITASMASGLSATSFGAYFLCPLTISGWIPRRFGFRVTFMTGYFSFQSLPAADMSDCIKPCRATSWLPSLLAQWRLGLLWRFLR